MKLKDIEEYEEGHHCYGDFLRVNGMDYEEIDKTNVVSLINEFMQTDDINRRYFIREAFKLMLEYLEFDYVKEESYSETCDQCFDWNHKNKYVRGE